MRGVKVIAVLLVVCLCFCGCSARKNLKDLSVAEGLGIDNAEQGKRVTVQTLNLAKAGNGTAALSGNVTLNTAGTGRNISSAAAQLRKVCPRICFSVKISCLFSAWMWR